MRSYDSKELIQYTGVTRSQLTHWLREGVLISRVRQAAGTGYHRRFSFVDLVEAVIAGQQASRGTSVSVMRRDFVQIRHYLWGHLATIAQNDWRRFRDPATRPADWSLRVLIAPELADDELITARLLFGPTDDGFQVNDHVLFSATIHIGNILAYLERRTGDRWMDGAEGLLQGDMPPALPDAEYQALVEQGRLAKVERMRRETAPMMKKLGNVWNEELEQWVLPTDDGE